MLTKTQIILKHPSTTDIFAAAALLEAIEDAKRITTDEEDTQTLVIYYLATSLDNIRRKSLEIISTAEGKLAAIENEETQ